MISKQIKMRVPFSYLDRQFHNYGEYLKDIEALVKTGDFTLGKTVGEFESRMAVLCKAPYAIGVGSGTDAIALSLLALGIGPGDEVITTPMTFIATVGAIVTSGARPVFVDSEDGYVIDPSKIEAAITSKTKAVVPVHYTGNMADMPLITEIARKHKLRIVEDGCQAINATINNESIGKYGDAGAISLHPLKNLNVWGDGGVIITHHKGLAEKLKLLRNHGLATRDEVTIFGRNSRLHSIQAAVGNRLLDEVEMITENRIKYAKRYDEAFEDLDDFIGIPKRRKEIKQVYHLYIIRARRRDELIKHLTKQGVEVKIHYPIPVHLQTAAGYLGYRKGDFPKCEYDCKNIISLPLHQHLTDEEIDYTIEQVRTFYLGQNKKNNI